MTVRIICDVIDRNVTMISNNGEWSSQPHAPVDIVIVYAGNGKYYKTEVGKFKL